MRIMFKSVKSLGRSAVFTTCLLFMLINSFVGVAQTKAYAYYYNPDWASVPFFSTFQASEDWHVQKFINAKYNYWHYKPKEDFNASFNLEDKDYKYLYSYKESFDYASEFNEQGVAVVKRDGKWFYITAEKRHPIPYQFDCAYNFYNGRAIVSEGGTWHAIDLNGDIISKDFDELHQRGPAIWGRYQNDDSYYLLTAELEKANERTFDFLNVLPCPTMADTPDVAQMTDTCYYAVCKEGGLYGVCDVEGNNAIPPKYIDFAIISDHIRMGSEYQTKRKLSHLVFTEVVVKNNLTRRDFNYFLMVKDAQKGKWGVVNLVGEQITPFKYKDCSTLLKKESKKLFKELKRLKTEQLHYNAVLQTFSSASSRAADSHRNLSSHLPQTPDLNDCIYDWRASVSNVNNVPDTTVVLLKNGKELRGEFREIRKYGKAFVLKDKQGKYGIMKNGAGSLIPQCEYDDVFIWDKSEYPKFLVSKSGKNGIVDNDCNITSYMEYDAITLMNEELHAGIAIKDGLYFVINEDGTTSKYAYDFIDDSTTPGILTVGRFGYKTEYLGSLGKEKESLFKVARRQGPPTNVSDNEKYQYWLNMVSLYTPYGKFSTDPDIASDEKGEVLFNIGNYLYSYGYYAEASFRYEAASKFGRKDAELLAKNAMDASIAEYKASRAAETAEFFNELNKFAYQLGSSIGKQVNKKNSPTNTNRTAGNASSTPSNSNAGKSSQQNSGNPNTHAQNMAFYRYQNLYQSAVSKIITIQTELKYDNKKYGYTLKDLYDAKANARDIRLKGNEYGKASGNTIPKSSLED